MQFPVFIELHRSNYLLFLLLLLHAVAAYCVMVLPYSWVLRAILLAFSGLSARYAFKPEKIVGLYLSGQGKLECLLTDGNRTAASVLPESSVFSRLIVLRLRLDEGKQVSQLALLPDHMDAGNFRVLRVWLRWASESRKHAENVF